MEAARTPRELISELHLFPHRDGYLAFHPPSFSLFRLGATFGRLLADLRRHPDSTLLAERYGVSQRELDARLAEIREKCERESTLRPPATDEPPHERQVGITLHVSNACNLGCLYCYAQGGDYGRRPQRKMDKSLAIRAIDKMYACFPNIRNILFFGGEPLLALDVIETVCRHIENRVQLGEIARMPDFKTVTNGTLIDDEAVRVIRRYGLRVTISIDGPKEIHDRLRPTKGGRGSYDAARRGFRRVVRDIGRIPQIEATYTRLHADEGLSMEALIEFLSREFLFTVGTVANVDLPSDHPLALPAETARTGTSDALSRLMLAMANGNVPKMERSFLFPILQFIKKEGTRFTCPVAYSGFDITTDGEIYPCQIFIGKPEFRIGTVDDFDPTAPTAEHLAVRRRLLYADKRNSPRCRRCWAQPFCTSCPGADLFAGNGYRVPNSFCAGMRRWMEDVLAMLYEIKSDPRLWQNFLDGLRAISQEVEKGSPPAEPWTSHSEAPDRFEPAPTQTKSTYPDLPVNA